MGKKSKYKTSVKKKTLNPEFNEVPVDFFTNSHNTPLNSSKLMHIMTCHVLLAPYNSLNRNSAPFMCPKNPESLI